MSIKCSCGASLEKTPLHRTQPFSAPDACYSCLACIQIKHPELTTHALVRQKLTYSFYQKECPLCFTQNAINADGCLNCIWDFDKPN